MQQQLQSRDPCSNLLDGPCFCFAKLKRFVGLVEYFFLCIFGVRIFVEFAVCECSLCGSIHRDLLFYSSASSHPIFISLFSAQCGKAFKCMNTYAMYLFQCFIFDKFAKLSQICFFALSLWCMKYRFM